MANSNTNSDAHPMQVGHCKENATNQYIGRGRNQCSMADTEPGTRGWLGNPYTVEEYGRERCLELFEKHFARKMLVDKSFCTAVLSRLGNRLGCWCRRFDEDSPACHGDIIIEYVQEFKGCYTEVLNPDDSWSRLSPHSACIKALIAGWDDVESINPLLDDTYHVELSGDRALRTYSPAQELRAIGVIDWSTDI